MLLGVMAAVTWLVAVISTIVSESLESGFWQMLTISIVFSTGQIVLNEIRKSKD